VRVVPQPYQKPHPPIRVAATTQDTFPIMGRQAHPIIVGLRGFDVHQVKDHLDVYREAWQEAGHPGQGDVYLRVPVYVGATDEKGQREPEASTMRSYQRLGSLFGSSAGQAGTTATEERQERAERLSQITYDDLLKDRLAYGSAATVVEKLQFLTDELGLSGVIMEPNVGGQLSRAMVLDSIRRYAEDVAPKLRQ
jgi:alkanesulfonate monooxygenase SsuD/methylene tetrahydromethanopterin reductase-like flavin-dependent oxidoreductase (luciferase family)